MAVRGEKVSYTGGLDPSLAQCRRKKTLEEALNNVPKHTITLTELRGYRHLVELAI